MKRISTRSTIAAGLVLVVLATGCNDQAAIERAQAAQQQAIAAQVDADARARSAEAQAQAEVARAQVAEQQAAAQLAQSAALSNTLGAQSREVGRLIDTVIAQANSTQALVLVLAGAPAQVVYLLQPPATISTPAQLGAHQVDESQLWPEERARRRALLSAPGGDNAIHERTNRP